MYCDNNEYQADVEEATYNVYCGVDQITVIIRLMLRKLRTMHTVE